LLMAIIVVTGGAGAIGSQLVAALLAQGHRVTVLDDLSGSLEENVPAGAEFVQGSILQPSALDEAFRSEVELVFHLAASFANQASVDDPEHDLRVNGLGTLRVAQKALELNRRRRAPRLIYASTSCVYGPTEAPTTEDAPLRPKTPYAASKLLGEHYLHYVSRDAELPVVILRLFNSYGPGELPGRYRGVVPNFIECALRGEPLRITGTGAETRDFTYVGDVVDALLRAALEPRAVGRTYNIGTGTATRIAELAAATISVCASSSEIRFESRRAWDAVPMRCADPGAAACDLGFAAQVSLQEGLARSVEWIRLVRDGASAGAAVTPIGNRAPATVL
jgi:UDP-glucose 4-epimerase